MRGWLSSLLVCLTVILAPALAQSQPPEELFVPILISGVVGESSHCQTIFRFVELSGTTTSPAVTVDVDIYDNAGKHIEPYQLFCPPTSSPLSPYPVQHRLNASGSVHFGTSGFITEQPTLAVDGWVRLKVTGPGLLQATAEVFQVADAPFGCPGVPICTRPSDLYKSDAVIQAVKPAKVWRAAAVITRYRHTAFSVVNPSATQSAHVLFALFRPDGTEYKGGVLTVPPMQRRSAFAWEWATFGPSVTPRPGPDPDDFYGSARIVSDVPVAVGALQVLLPEGTLVSAVVTPEL